MPFLALITTPSIAPSAAEETLPVRLCASAGAWPKMVASAAAAIRLISFVRIAKFLLGLGNRNGRPVDRPLGVRSSVQRLQLDDVGAVIAADPERGRRRAVVDEHAPDVGGLGQQVLGELA